MNVDGAAPSSHAAELVVATFEAKTGRRAPC